MRGEGGREGESTNAGRLNHNDFTGAGENFTRVNDAVKRRSLRRLNGVNI